MFHAMIYDSDNSDEVLLSCTVCTRKVVVGKAKPKFVVLDQGDFYATHSTSRNIVIDGAVVAQG